MSLRIIATNNNYYGFEKLLEKLKNNINGNNFLKHYIIVPDKISLNVEKAVFEKLNLQCTFNIEVLTLSRLISKILILNGKTILSKQASIMAINNILHKNIDNLCVFKSAISFNGFSENLFETIGQLKSCNILPENIAIETKDMLFNYKVNDIKLVYENYENYLLENNFYDCFDKLKIATDDIKANKNFENTALYFAYFNSLTAEQLNFLSSLTEKAKEINFECVFPCMQANAEIYPTELFYSLSQLKKDDVEIIKCNAEFKPWKKHLLKNIFATNFSKMDLQNNCVALFENLTIEDEITNIAKIIKIKIIEEKLHYCDFAILCCDFNKYKSEIKSVFEKFDLPVFFDDSISLSEHFVSKYIINLVNIAMDNFEKNNVFDFVKSIFSPLTVSAQNNFENVVLKFGIDNGKFKKIDNYKESFGEDFETIKKMLNDLFDFQSQIKMQNQIFQKIEIVRSFLKNNGVWTKLQNIVANFNKEKNFVWQKFSEEVFDEINNIFDEIKIIFRESTVSNKEFVDILKSGIESVKLNLIPTSADNIFVGDISNSMILPIKNLIVIGASESNLPAIKKDCGLLVDEELKQFGNNKVEPTIRQINKRTKFFEIEQLLNANDNLILSYCVNDANSINSPSLFIKYIQEIFEFKQKKLPIIRTNFLQEDLNNVELLKFFTANLQSEKQAKNFVIKNYDNNKLKNYVEFIINKTKFNLTENNCDNDVLELSVQENKKLFFKNNRVSASQLECYFACPYKHFFRYAISPSEREISKIKPMEIGTLLHFVAQKFIENYSGESFEQEQLQSVAIEYFEMAQKKQNCKFVFDNNSNFVKSLKEEAIRLVKKLYFEQQNSKFNNFAVEYKFNNKSMFDELSFYGLVDRIDVFDNYFRIIDYKSISSDSSSSIDLSLSKLFTGQKLQLFLYADAVEKILNKQLCGVFYFPIKNSFAINSEENESAILTGYYLNNGSTIEALDKTGTEQIVELKLSHSLSKQQMKSLCDYAVEISTNAIYEIINGNVCASAFGEEQTRNVCTYCEFKTMCNFDAVKNGIRKFDKKISIDIFEKAVTDGK